MQSVKLPRLLALLPKDGVNSTVYQSRWADKGFSIPSSSSSSSSSSTSTSSGENVDDGTCKWVVKKVKLNYTEAGKVAGRAWGVKYWRGKRITPLDQEFEKIRGALKYGWNASNCPPALLKAPRAVEKAE